MHLTIFVILSLFRLIQGQTFTFTPTGKPFVRPTDVRYINVTERPQGANNPVPEAYISYSIEFALFPDFAGNKSHPNNFSENLLNNLADYGGTKPYIRVGGNTQDYAVFYPFQKEAMFGTINPDIPGAADYPTTVSIGGSFFESYSTFSNTKYIHGFNLGKNDTGIRGSTLSSVSAVCNALRNTTLLYWELGNEPDLFKTSVQGIVRSRDWDEKAYVAEWLNFTREIKGQMRTHCPELATDDKFKWTAPSFAGVANSLDAVKTWAAGLNADQNIVSISSHNYIDGATSPGVTLQGTLMNHTRTVYSLGQQINLAEQLKQYRLPFYLGETNSLFNAGRPGLSNTFGAALWGLDFVLYSAANSISRIFFHQGTNYRYVSWQPIDTPTNPASTRAPYYGNIAAAAMIGNSTGQVVQINNLPLDNETEAAYAAYENAVLKRVLVINMRSYNYTVTSPIPRPVETYYFSTPTSCAGIGALRRLMANGSDAVTGVSWDGMSYAQELNMGKAVRMLNATKGETVFVGQDGNFQLQVPWSSAVLVSLDCQTRR